MTLRSPWRSRLFVAWVATVRWLLHWLPGAENGFIRWLVMANNRRIERYLAGRDIRNVLLIMPRCVKKSDCRCNVRGQAKGEGRPADNRQPPLADCLTCDLCPLGGVARLTQKYGVRALVAYRSHIAYAMARQERPDLIIAMACEDRLIKALRSVPEIPALLAPLQGMESPCRNAACDLTWLESQIQATLERAGLPDATAPQPSFRSVAAPLTSTASEKQVRSVEGL
jgi:hypothetical protein